jgi:hypothetical protein
VNRVNWRAAATALSIGLVLLSFLLPLYSQPTLGSNGRTLVYAWSATREDAAFGLVFLVPLAVVAAIHVRLRRPWRGLVMASVPLLLGYSTMVIYLESALALHVEPLPWPMTKFPGLWAPSTVGVGCWAVVAANVVLLGVWGAAVIQSYRSRLRSGRDPIAAT